jgi:hypothetical protein
MTELRLRSKITAGSLEQKVGRLVTPFDYDIMLTGPSVIRKPDGRPLCVYVPGGIRQEADAFYPTLTTIRGTTDNRGLASGTVRAVTGPAATRSRTMHVMSSVLGAMDPGGRFQYCRLTAFSAKETAKWEHLRPLWQRIAKHLEANVPDRYAAQAREAARTHPDWVIPGTPFTTITVNNSYATGVHTDKGDLDAGFSCLGVMRRGEYTGGHIVFPEYRVAADLQHGDLMLMDSHDWHGNTALMCGCGKQMLNVPCQECGAERISIVCYFRTGMVACGTPSDEHEKRLTARTGPPVL